MYEAPANMEEKIRRLSQRISEISKPFYETATQEDKDELLRLTSELDLRMMEYRAYRIPWDSKLIDSIGNIDEVRFKTKAISTFDSVMDKAREIFVLVAGRETDGK